MLPKKWCIKTDRSVQRRIQTLLNKHKLNPMQYDFNLWERYYHTNDRGVMQGVEIVNIPLRGYTVLTIEDLERELGEPQSNKEVVIDSYSIF